MPLLPPLYTASFCGYIRLEEAPARGLKAKPSPSQTASSESLRGSFASREARASTKSLRTSRGYTRRRLSARSKKRYRQVIIRVPFFCADRCGCAWGVLGGRGCTDEMPLVLVAVAVFRRVGECVGECCTAVRGDRFSIVFLSFFFVVFFFFQKFVFCFFGFCFFVLYFSYYFSFSFFLFFALCSTVVYTFFLCGFP